MATRGANFLNLRVGARAQALGGAYTGYASGVSALYWNTAGIAFEERALVNVTYSSLYSGLDMEQIYGGVVIPVGGNRLAISFNQLSSGDILRTDEDFPEGGNPQFGDTFEWSAVAVGLHFARAVTDRLAFGITGKFIQEGISGARADFVAADFSVLFDTGLFGTRLGASFFNIGGDSRIEGALTRQQTDQTRNDANEIEARRIFEVGFQTTAIELPTGFRVGISTELWGGAEAMFAGSAKNTLLFVGDVWDQTDTALMSALGFEYNYNKILYLRVGKRFLNEDQISQNFSDRLGFGGGVAIPLGQALLTFDYAYSDVGDLDNIQTFEFELAF